MYCFKSRGIRKVIVVVVVASVLAFHIAVKCNLNISVYGCVCKLFASMEEVMTWRGRGWKGRGRGLSIITGQAKVRTL